MKALPLALLLSLAAATSSFAGQCPVLMKEIDEATVSYDQEGDWDVSKVKEHRIVGEIAHFAGDHSQADARLTFHPLADNITSNFN